MYDDFSNICSAIGHIDSEIDARKMNNDCRYGSFCPWDKKFTCLWPPSIGFEFELDKTYCNNNWKSQSLFLWSMLETQDFLCKDKTILLKTSALIEKSHKETPASKFYLDPHRQIQLGPYCIFSWVRDNKANKQSNITHLPLITCLLSNINCSIVSWIIFKILHKPTNVVCSVTWSCYEEKSTCNFPDTGL